MLPRKMCGGGSSLGSAQPSAQQSSQMPANRPMDRHVHQTLDKRVEAGHRREQTGYRRRAGCSGGGARITVARDDGHQADLYLSLP